MNKYYVIIITILFVLSIFSCDKTREPIEQDDTPYELTFGALPAPTLPEDNQLTQQGVELGRKLFYDPILSSDGEQACASCHRQEHGFTDTTRFSLGVQGLPGKRQAMSVFNMAWHSNEFFWDGRAHLLRDQALLPIQDELEMDESLDNVINKLSASQDYKDDFTRTFGTEDITSEKIALALEQFMNSIVSHDSKYDQWKAGKVSLTESEERGRLLYETEYNPFFPEFSGADCAHCHGGANFENDLYMNNGLDSEDNITDIGRESVTLNPADKGKFKVPTLRNIELTAPYMHDGRFATLEEVIDHYNEGIKVSNSLDQALLATEETGLFLDEQAKLDLLNFLKTLTDYSFINDERYSDPFE